MEICATNRKKIDERINELERKLNEIVSLFKTSIPQVSRYVKFLLQPTMILMRVST